MKLWIVSMECAGIVEAGGVKNVTYSLCKEFSRLGHDVTLFIPVFKCNSWDLIYNLEENIIDNIEIFHCGKNEKVSYSKALCKEGNFKVVFVNHAAFANKEGVYTYTANEALLNPEHKKGTGHVDTLFMDCIFAKAVCKYAELTCENPDVVHCQDASTAVIPSIARNLNVLDATKFVVTIHNAGPAYHHSFSSMGEAAWYTGLPELELINASNHNQIEPFLLASNSGAYLTTVSEDYAKELRDPYFEKETDGLSTIFFAKYTPIEGITNGIDYDLYNPTKKDISRLPFEFNPETLDLNGKYKCRDFLFDRVAAQEVFEDIKYYGSINKKEAETVICYHGRITNQKGLSVLIDSIPAILNNYQNVVFVIAGQGETSLENDLITLSKSYSGKVLFFNGYNKKIARLVNAIGDFIVLPSFFEPCGLEDFISQLYGTIPVAHATGGLKKIINMKTGFLYNENKAENLIAKLSEIIAIKKYNPQLISDIICEGAKHVHTNYLWENVIKSKYLKFFEEILKK